MNLLPWCRVGCVQLCYCIVIYLMYIYCAEASKAATTIIISIRMYLCARFEVGLCVVLVRSEFTGIMHCLCCKQLRWTELRGAVNLWTINLLIRLSIHVRRNSR